MIALFEILNYLRIAAVSRQRIPVRYNLEAGIDARAMLNKILHYFKVVMNGGYLQRGCINIFSDCLIDAYAFFFNKIANNIQISASYCTTHCGIYVSSFWSANVNSLIDQPLNQFQITAFSRVAQSLICYAYAFTSQPLNQI